MRWLSLLHTWLPASRTQWNGRKNRSYSWGLLKTRPAGLLKSLIPWLADCGNSNDLAWMTVPFRASPNLSPSFSKLSMFWSLIRLIHFPLWTCQRKLADILEGLSGHGWKSYPVPSLVAKAQPISFFYLGFDRWTFFLFGLPKNQFREPPFSPV